MSRERHERMLAIFSEARRLKHAERAAYLRSACGDDDELRAEVESLLGHHHPSKATVQLRAPSEISGRRGGAEADGSKRATVPIAGARAAGAPQQVGPYRIIRTLGRGGMGTVYEAEQERPRRTVALKVINPGVAAPRMIRRFEFEAQVLGSLQHVGIAQIFEADTCDVGDGAQPYFAMELIEGDPLDMYARVHRLTARARLELVAKVCDAVHHAHQRGIIHRDLKPGNILVDATGQPKVLDFGVARATDADLQRTSTMTNVGQLIGTVPYMSPEQASGDPAEIDTRSDVYALGVLAYELLTGSLPYDVHDRALHEAVRAIRETAPRPISTIDRTLTGDVETIVGKALEKEKERRYQSAAEFAEDLRRFLRSEPILARPPSVAYQLRMFARRNKPFVAAAAVVALALIGATIVSVTFAVSEARQRASAEQRFEDVRRLANIFLFEIDDQLQGVAGTTPARRTLVTTGLTYLDRLADDPRADPPLLDELADAYIRVGDIQGNPRKPNLGDTEAALASYRKSLEIRRTLVDQVPNDPSMLLKLAGAQRKMGTLQSHLGGPQDSLDAYLRALEITEKVVAAHGDNLDALREQVTLLGTIGDVQRQMGRLEDAGASFDRELTHARALAELDSGLPTRRMVSIAYNDVGSVRAALGRHEDALAYYLEAMEIREAIAEEAPEDVRARRDVAISLSRIAGAYRNLDQYPEALATTEQALGIMERVAASDPSNVRAQGDLAIYCEKVGQALRDFDRTEEALEAFQRCVSIRRTLVEDNPQDLRTRTGLAVGLERCGDVLHAMERRDEALDRYREAMNTATAVLEIDSRNALTQTVSCMVAYKLGEVHEAMSIADPAASSPDATHLAEAARWYARSADVRTAAAALQVRLQARPEGLDAALERLGIEADAASPASAGAAGAGAEPE